MLKATMEIGFVLAAATTLQPPLPDDVWRAWNWDPLLMAGLLLGFGLYLRGVRRLWRRAGAGRGVSFAQVVAFTVGMMALVAALMSPLEAMSEALLAAHMVQHLLLMLVAAPLLVLGASPVAIAWALNDAGPSRSAGSSSSTYLQTIARWWRRRAALRPFADLRRLWRALFRRPVSWFTFNAVLWLWHLPALYEAAILDEGVHIFEHITFLVAALFFWSTVLHGEQHHAVRRPAGTLGSYRAAGAALYVFTTALLSGLLGVLLTFSQRVWYPVYGVVPYGWGLTPLQDQQLAGVIMWFPGGLVYLAATLALLGSALQRRGGKEKEKQPPVAVLAPRRGTETDRRSSDFAFSASKSKEIGL